MLGGPVGCDTIPGLESDDSGRFPSSPLQASDSTLVEPSLKAALRTPDTVPPGNAFAVRISVKNRTRQPVTVTTGSTALWDWGIYDGDEVVLVEGTMLLYAAVVTDHTINPGAAHQHRRPAEDQRHDRQRHAQDYWSVKPHS